MLILGNNFAKYAFFMLALAFSLMFFAPVPAEAAIITCGRTGQQMCTLCDLIAGLNNVIQYIMQIAVGVALLAVTIGGVIYAVSAGDSGMIEMAKTTMKNALIGFVIIFSAWVIINTTINMLGAYENLGMNIVSWGRFECSRRP